MVDHPTMMLKVIVYAYSLGIYCAGADQLIQLCGKHAAFWATETEWVVRILGVGQGADPRFATGHNICASLNLFLSPLV